MKSYWYFVRKVSGFTPSDVVYKVAVGASMREAAKCELIKQYARDCAFYFNPVSQTSDKTIMTLASSLFTGSLFPMMYLRRADVSVNTLFDLIVDDGFDSFEATLTAPRSIFKTLSLLSPDFLWYHSHPHCITKSPTLRRKYLSHSCSTEAKMALMKFGLILGLFLLSGYLEHLERVTF